jgi:uncharacterized protein (TIGR03435 family)
MMFRSYRALPVCFLLLAYSCSAQSDSQHFETASIRLSASQSGPGSTDYSATRLTARNVPLAGCIRLAFNVKSERIEGPGWMLSTRFDIEAKAPASVANPEILKMLQNLLLDRFGLRYHMDTRTVAGFRLEIDPAGLKLEDVGPKPRAGRLMISAPERGLLESVAGVTMDRLSDFLSQLLGAPVLDNTGKTDYYALRLRYSPLTAVGGAATADDPLLEIALKQQAGLLLQSGRVPLTYLVVDSVQKIPTPN